MRKFLLFFLAGSLFLAGCSKNSNDEVSTLDPPTQSDEPPKIPINITTNVWTKATDAAFEQGDKAGIYVVNFNGTSAGSLVTTGNHVDNMRFTLSETWTPDTPIYWKDQTTKADFYCYYPYTESIVNIATYAFSVKADQSSESNYKASDFLWGKTTGVVPTANPVQITVKHMMSNLLIYLKAGNGYTEEELDQAEITICGLKTDATINLATGIVTTTGTVTDITPKAETDYYRALVVPQSITDADLIKVSIGENEYVLKQTVTFETNKQHTCTLTVNKTGEGINIGIDSWETDDTDYGGVVE